MSDVLKHAMGDTGGIAVSLDMDFVDPSDAPGVGTPVLQGRLRLWVLQVF